MILVVINSFKEIIPLLSSVNLEKIDLDSVAFDKPDVIKEIDIITE